MGVDLSFEDIESFVAARFSWILVYFLCLYVFAFLFGRYSWQLISDADLDRRYPVLGLSDWYYMFTGANKLRENPEAAGVVVYIYIHAAGPNEDILYTGFLTGWRIGRNGQIEYLVLNEVYRAPFYSGATALGANEDSSEVVGDSFTIMGTEIKDFSLRYFVY